MCCQGAGVQDPQWERQTHLKLQRVVVQLYRIIGTVVPLHYRIIRLLWVGPSVQPSLRIVLLVEKKGNERDNGSPLMGRSHALCSHPRPRGVSDCVEAGRLWLQRKHPRPSCRQRTSKVWSLPLVLFCASRRREAPLHGPPGGPQKLCAFMKESGLSVPSWCLGSAKGTTFGANLCDVKPSWKGSSVWVCFRVRVPPSTGWSPPSPCSHLRSHLCVSATR